MTRYLQKAITHNDIFKLCPLFAPINAFFLLTILTLCDTASSRAEEHSPFVFEADFSNHWVQSKPRPNPYQLTDQDFTIERTKGLRYAMEYPITVTGVVLPYRPLKEFLDQPHVTVWHEWLRNLFADFTDIRSLDDLVAAIGLTTYPANPQPFPYEVPEPTHPELKRLGSTTFKRRNVEVVAFGCVTCHSSNLFGRKLVGISNRTPHPYDFSYYANKVAAVAPPFTFQAALNATDEETEIYRQTRAILGSVGVRRPQALGMDTSVSSVGLSLSRRGEDEDASYSEEFAAHPRPSRLDTHAADGKPPVWWNLKYKTRWLADGSNVSGNPVLTNILWNEIGRATDLKLLRKWLSENTDKIKALTTSVFSTEAPLYTDFFPATHIRLESAKRGEAVFKVNCAKCHGQYDKNWNRPDANTLSLADQLKTEKVRYLSRTPVIDVGTDPARRRGIGAISKMLNRLAISKDYNLVVEEQSGYVPPPLVGIWARWPYFHNNAIPSLCALLTPAALRPKTYYTGEAIDPTRDFDEPCNGYPLGDKIPDEWKEKSRLYDTAREGASNVGHDEGILTKNGKSLLTIQNKADLIQFLKTL